MTSKFRPTGSGWAIIVLSLAALALGGCGRKGPLDLPPTASNAAAPATPDTDQAAESKPSLFNPTYGTEAAPAATKGSKRSFILDPLLDK